MENFTIKSKDKYEIIDITEKVADIVKKSKIKEGTCLVYAAHASAAIFINENHDPNLRSDIINALDRLIPEGIWQHDKIDNNAAAHIKAAIIGPSETIPVKDNRLQLGTWQSIGFLELDGPRSRNIIVVVR